MPTIAINGLGRIGRAALKILLDSDGLDLVAVNDVADVDNLAYLLKYDTVYGRYHFAVDAVAGIGVALAVMVWTRSAIIPLHTRTRHLK